MQCQRALWEGRLGDAERHMQAALDLYPSVLRWHLSRKMSNYHGSLDPPGLDEQKLSGFVTSYDPGQGFGNPWNGWGKLGVSQPRNFNPHTLPYFAQQYFFRERCWNYQLTEDQFLARLQRRLFDADAPADAVAHYWRLSQMARAATHKRPETFPAAELLASERQFLDSLRRGNWTPRMADTIARMDEAVAGLAGGPQQIRALK